MMGIWSPYIQSGQSARKVWVDIDWLAVKAEGVASLLIYSMVRIECRLAHTASAACLHTRASLSTLSSCPRFDLGKLATGSLGLVITETQGTSRQLDIQLGANLVVDPASLLQEYIKSSWMRNALTTIFPFLDTALAISLNCKQRGRGHPFA
ncbi:hypothetical protein HaLaN_20058 [Haematococcus lacustris]|uniref:Uncharacterized protein n=1 Tax=Haematococcus lacustris TaxID=44745 RepID=A0A699ZV17_HAELA|nr:hypothetical protein HaLaN_20058 [Haematococcus lacustris]